MGAEQQTQNESFRVTFGNDLGQVVRAELDPAAVTAYLLLDAGASSQEACAILRITSTELVLLTARLQREVWALLQEFRRIQKTAVRA